MTQLQELKEDDSACQYTNKNEPLVVKMTVVTAREKQHMGTFKMGYMAVTDQPLFGGNERTVCAKQAYQTVDRARKIYKTYGYKDQKPRLETELGALVFGRALLEYVYIWMEQWDQLPVHTEVVIPQFCFVKAALGLEGEEVGSRQAFMLEEWINTSDNAEGRFRKYINNNQPWPVERLNEEDALCARFLCFTQHVQYVESGKLAFASDYQGRDHSHYSNKKLMFLNLRQKYSAYRSTDYDEGVSNRTSDSSPRESKCSLGH